MNKRKFLIAAAFATAGLTSGCESIGEALIDAAVDAAFDSGSHTRDRHRHSDWEARAVREANWASPNERRGRR